MRFRKHQAIKLLQQSLVEIALVIIGFVLGHDLGLEPGTTAMFGAVLLLRSESPD